MVREPALVAKPESAAIEEIELIKDWHNEPNGFKSYDIDLTKLGTDRWVGVSPVVAGRRSSFDTYDYQFAVQLSAANWYIWFVPLDGMQLVSGSEHETVSVPTSQALQKVYYESYLAKLDSLSGMRDLAIILFSVLIGTGSTTSVGAAWRLASRRKTGG